MRSHDPATIVHFDAMVIYQRTTIRLKTEISALAENAQKVSEKFFTTLIESCDFLLHC